MSEKINTELAIEVRGLVKRYTEEVLAVDGVDLSIAPNTIYAMLGPNGAGKTTTISVLTTLLPADGGYSQGVGPRCRHAGGRGSGAYRRDVSGNGSGR